MHSKIKVGIASLLLMAGTAASALSKWYLVWIAQALGGPHAVGTYSIILAVATPIFVTAQLGLRTIFLTMRTAWPWRSYVFLRVVGLALASVAVVIILLVVPAVPLLLGTAIIAMKLFDSMLDLDLARIQYGNNIPTLGVIGIAGAAVSILISSVAAFLWNSLLIAVIGAALASALTAAYAMKRARSVFYPAVESGTGYREILRASVPVTGAQLLASVLTYLPIFILGFQDDLHVVGVYAAIAYILTAADLTGASIAKVMITPLRRLLVHAGVNRVVHQANRISLGVMICGLAGGLLLVLFGDALFMSLYGPAFKTGTATLGLLAAASVFLLVSYTQSVALNILNRYYHIAYSFAIACLVSAITGVFLSVVGTSGLIVGSAMAAMGAATRAFLMRTAIVRAHREWVEE
ncbi:lipopolysaccharide biosynthesis protein [Tessaracoccus sp. Y36]